MSTSRLSGWGREMEYLMTEDPIVEANRLACGVPPNREERHTQRHHIQHIIVKNLPRILFIPLNI